MTDPADAAFISLFSAAVALAVAAALEDAPPSAIAAIGLGICIALVLYRTFGE